MKGEEKFSSFSSSLSSYNLGPRNQDEMKMDRWICYTYTCKVSDFQLFFFLLRLGLHACKWVSSLFIRVARMDMDHHIPSPLAPTEINYFFKASENSSSRTSLSLNVRRREVCTGLFMDAPLPCRRLWTHFNSAEPAAAVLVVVG